MSATFNQYGPVCPTRFSELSYQRISATLWRIVHNETGACVGPQYRTLRELLGDLERYARDFGVAGY